MFSCKIPLYQSINVSNAYIYPVQNYQISMIHEIATSIQVYDSRSQSRNVQNYLIQCAIPC
jgi:hypothetical protein